MAPSKHFNDDHAEHILQAKFGTRAVHAGQHPDPITGAVIPPLSLSTTFKQHSAGEHNGFDYSRSGNPSRHAFETAVAALEGAKYGLAFSSGSATTATIVSALPAGSHIVSVTFVDLADAANVASVIRPNTKLVWVETPTNPTLRLVDIKAVAEIAHKHNTKLVVDNTFMSPFFQNPLSLGADIVVHSVTKYINGHSDVVMGVAVTSNEEIYTKLAFLQNSIGAVPSAFDCFLANRGLKTLHLRMRQHATSAQAIAEALEASPRVENVIYPGLPSHPQHDLAKRQQKGFGGMISFRIKGDLATANAFLRHVKFFTLAESLGGVESLCELPATMTHGSVSAED
ncbi:hypothetical protein BGZ47_000447, partial [Haplosporangium gracile]